ncbi:MAG: DUF3822 family protein [Flavobacteriales bacterium]
MATKYTVFYEATSLSIIRHVDGETQTYMLKSNENHLKVEESTAFIKEFTQSSFLHVPEFEHFICSENGVSLPASIFEEQAVNAYYERLYGELNDQETLRFESLNQQKVIRIFNVPSWTITLLERHFSKTNISSVFESQFQALELYLQRKVVVSLFISPQFAHLVLFKKGDLFFIDTISFDRLEDILFHLVTLLSKNNATEDSGVLLMQNIHPTHTLQEIKALIAQISSFNALEVLLKHNQIT